MQASRILPDLQCSLICEDVRQEATGNFILVGVIDIVRVPQVPVTAHKLTVFNRWTAGLGQFGESVRLIAPDENTVVCKSDVKFAMKDPNINATTVTLFGNVKFESAGTYYVEVTVDDVMKVRYPLNVVVQPQQGQGQQGTPPQQQPPSGTSPS